MIELDKIYNEDCLIGMQRIPDGSVDCIICDLPYGTTRNQWDSVIPLDKLWEQYERVIKPNGAIALFSQQPFTSVLVASNMSMFKYEWIWEKDSGTGLLNSKYAPMKIHENICVFSKSAACFVKDKAKAMSYNPQMRTGFALYKSKANNFGSNYDTRYMKEVVAESNGERYPIDIIKFNRDRDKVHPTQKPVDLIRYLVRTYTDEGELVLDNCMGSGTTAIACIKEKRHFVGFELNAEYYKIALKRISTEETQLSLF